MGGNADLPAGIAWRREGPHVVGRVLVVQPDGKREHVATVRYATDEDAVVAVGHMLDAIGGRR
jgi:hypothetical protein